MGKLTIEKAAFYAGIVNGSRKEIITSDSTGGFRVWALRFTPSSGYKGFLRVHAGNRKSHYRYLFLTRNEEVILACTPSRIQAFDATTCARITTLYRSTTGSIAHVGWDDESDALHLSLSNQPRQVLKYTLASNRGRQLVLNSEAKACANEDIAVFTTANVDQSALKAETVNFDGIFFVDDCGNFTVSANRSLEVDGDSSNQQAPTISLQLSPSTEHYLELHTLSSAQYRTFVVAVCSSGIYVIETFLPGSITRRVITNVPGTSLKATQHGEWRRIAVHCAEPPSLLLLDSEEDQFCAMVLQPPGVTDSSSTSGQPKLPTLVDYAAFPDAIVMAWSNGLVSRYSLTTGRTQAMFCVKNPTTLVVLRISVGNQLIVVGDEDGVIAVWSVAVDREQKEISTHEVCSGRYVPQPSMVSCIKNLRNALSSVAAILNICMAKTVEAAISLISLSSGGDVKMWSMQFGQAAVQWTLLACFHTYASSLSASALLSPGYVFCGSEEGGFECWKVPDASAIMATSMLHPSHRAVVVKRPVHSLDVHLSRICQIVVEPGDAGKRMTEAPVYLDEFTWIVTYDSDAIALIWCMSPSFLYPHRRIKLHGNPLGSYLTLHDSTALRFYAYLGRCLECVDILTEGDKISSKDRLRRGREKSSEVQYQDHVRYDISGQRQSNNIDVAQTSEYSSSENCSPALRIRITVPTIDYAYFSPDGEHVMPKQPPTPISSKITKYVDRESPCSVPQRAKSPSKHQQGDADGIVGTHLSREDSCSKKPLDYELPDLTAPEDISPQRDQAVAPKRVQNPRVRPQTTFVPETLPSQFRLAKPRIYRNDSCPQTSLQQKNCSVVTTSIGFSGRQGHNSSENAETDDSTLVLIGGGEGSKGQDKLAIVGVVDGTHTELRLDFQGRGRPGGVARSQSSRSTGVEKLFGSSSVPLFVPWNALSNEQQLAELTAASRSRCIQGDSDEDAIDVPSVADFSNPDIKVQLKVRSFSRWYLSRYQSRQYHREAFLWEELACAVSDIFVQTEVSQAGLRIPSPEDRDSSVWRDFCRWYAFGKTQLVSTSDKPQPERLESRLTFLERRLRILTEAEERHRRNNSAVDLMKTQLFVFDDLSVSPSIESVSISAWEPLDIALKQSEMALALRDPDIQIAAISSQIDLPDIDAVLIPGCDVLALSNAFVSWWATDGNKHRRNFLSLEAEEAGQDGTVHEILEQEAQNTGEDEREGKSFVGSYFGSKKARLDFLERKLVRLRQEHRIRDVFMYAKLPAPVLFEAMVIPLLVAFSFPEPVVVRSDDVPPFTGTDHGVDAQADSSSAEMGGREHAIEDAVVDESDVERNAIELELMTIEDALSRELGNTGVDSESEDEHEEVERHIEPPKRTDFTRSYFFGNLPSSVRLTSDGWAAGSGVDNGDEEIEEEERLERERKHQEMLDRQEAERLAELERLAEQARLEKEKEEKALQLRRLRLAELKKVLAHQAELEAARIEQLERESMEDNLLLMAHEDFDERSRMRNLEQERVATVLEDEQSRKVERAIRDAHVQAMRKLLAELAAMTAEDKRSAIVQKEQQLLDEAQARRRQYLQALYTPTDPFFAASKSPSEEMLPALHDRCLDSLRKVKGQQQPRYALSFAETVVLDEVVHEVYVARDSRKLRVLMGLSTASSASRKTMRIPSERDIIKQRHQQQLQILEADEDHGPETRVERAMTVQRKKRPNQENSRATTKLPHLLQWKAAEHTRLTDLSTTAHQNQSTTKSTDKKARGNNIPPSSTVLPFFRGNFGVRGEGKTRATDYIE